MNLILPESLGYIFTVDGMGLSTKFPWWAPKCAYFVHLKPLLHQLKRPVIQKS